MNVYVLLERTSYEGENLIGVYATDDECRQIITSKMASDDYDGDDLSIYQITVGDPPLDSYGAKPIYSEENHKKVARFREYERIRKEKP